MGVLPFPLFAQNLVPNGDFETRSSCPHGLGQMTYAVPWTAPTEGTPDYIHACGMSGLSVPESVYGYQEAHSGDGYAGIISFNKLDVTREYIQVALTDTLEKNQKYQIGFWANLADKYLYSISTLGAYLSRDTISRSDRLVINVTPQILNPTVNPLNDRDNWILVTDTFTSIEGGEKYITIGNFHSDLESDTAVSNVGTSIHAVSYYLIDDVFVIPADIYNSMNELNGNDIRIFPNPTNGQMYIDYPLLEDNTTFELYDATGRVVTTCSMLKGQNTVTLDERKLGKGIYFYRIYTHYKLIKEGKVIFE